MNESKKDKFQELENMFSNNLDMLNFSKSQWLANRGNYYAKQGDFYKAVDDFKEAISIKPDNVAAYMGLGVVYRENRMFNKAIEIIEKTPREMAMNESRIPRPDFHYYAILGTAYYAKGDKEKAVENIKKSLAVADSALKKTDFDWNGIFGDDEEFKKIMEVTLREIEDEKATDLEKKNSRELEKNTLFEMIKKYAGEFMLLVGVLFTSIGLRDSWEDGSFVFGSVVFALGILIILHRKKII